MATKRDEQAADYRAEAIARPFAEAAERSSTVSETGDGQSGLRTERVTLEITQFNDGGYKPASEWDWDFFLRGEALTNGESVRVVDTHAEAVAESVAWEGARDAYRGRILRLTAERDAAICGRDELREQRRTYFPTFTVQDVAKIQNDADRGVKVWQDAHMKALVERNEAREERDAAIRERDALRASAMTQSLTADRIAAAVQEADALRARVAELEAQNVTLGEGLRESGVEDSKEVKNYPTIGQMIEETCKQLATAMRVADIEKRRGDKLHSRVKELEAASGGGEGEAVAYFVKWNEKDWGVQDQTFRTLQRAQDYIKDEKSEDEKPQIVPLFDAPPQPRGWLTKEQREFLESAKLASALRTTIPKGSSAMSASSSHIKLNLEACRILDAILARSTPPEVELPEMVIAYDDMEALKEALAAAGVAVKEVGRE